MGDNFAQKAQPLNRIHKIILGLVVVVQALPQAVDATVLRVPRRCSNFEASVSGVHCSRVFAAISIAGLCLACSCFQVLKTLNALAANPTLYSCVSSSPSP
ncbi:uncharacterized protein G2W53_028871 [Senna tora]|uniref:CASP-like protein n=1 Tax=Senna tora TaxID=362788 RepID=A0A834T476_9FABA|nr:uncharacterized protein G2W53_028871 [Senna tora]